MKRQGCQFLLYKLPLTILTIHFCKCIPISECPYQLKTNNEKNKSFIPLIVDNNFSLSNNFQI